MFRFKQFSLAALAKRDAKEDPFGSKPSPAPATDKQAQPASDDESQQEPQA